MRKYSFLSAHGTLFNSALMTSAVTVHKFRTAHVQFYLDLYSNFLEYHTFGWEVEIQAVQINRALEAMAKNGCARIEKEGTRKTYTLTSRGFLEVLREMMDHNKLLPLEEATFIKYLVQGYGHTIQNVIREELSGPEIDDALKKFLDPLYIIKRQSSILERAIRNVRRRIEDYETYTPPNGLSNMEKLTDEQVHEFASKFPFRLAYRKSLQELFAEFPHSLMIHEVTHGFQNRKDNLLRPLLSLMEKKQNQLVELLEPDT